MIGTCEEKGNLAGVIEMEGRQSSNLGMDDPQNISWGKRCISSQIKKTREHTSRGRGALKGGWGGGNNLSYSEPEHFSWLKFRR